MKSVQKKSKLSASNEFDKERKGEPEEDRHSHRRHVVGESCHFGEQRVRVARRQQQEEQAGRESKRKVGVHLYLKPPIFFFQIRD